MYGTVARIHVKPGMEEQFLACLEKDPGEVAAYLYRLDADPNLFYLVAVFESKAAYEANARRPQTDARYWQVREYFDSEPEWHDGEIVFAFSETNSR